MAAKAKSPARAEPDCRRRTRRLPVPDDTPATVEFGYPTPDHPRCTMRVQEISTSGLSFTLAHELPGIEIGCNLDRAKVRIGELNLRGDLVVMRLTPDGSAGSACGVLFYPATDGDIVKLRKLIAELEARQAAPQPRT